MIQKVAYHLSFPIPFQTPACFGDAAALDYLIGMAIPCCTPCALINQKPFQVSRNKVFIPGHSYLFEESMRNSRIVFVASMIALMFFWVITCVSLNHSFVTAEFLVHLSPLPAIIGTVFFALYDVIFILTKLDTEVADEDLFSRAMFYGTAIIWLLLQSLVIYDFIITIFSYRASNSSYLYSNDYSKYFFSGIILLMSLRLLLLFLISEKKVLALVWK